MTFASFLLYNLNWIEVVKDHIFVTLSPEDVDFVVDKGWWMAISTLRHLASLLTLVPS